MYRLEKGKCRAQLKGKVEIGLREEARIVLKLPTFLFDMLKGSSVGNERNLGIVSHQKRSFTE